MKGTIIYICLIIKQPYQHSEMEYYLLKWIMFYVVYIYSSPNSKVLQRMLQLITI